MRHAQRALERHQEDLSMAQRQRCADGLQPHENSSWWRLGGILHASCAPVPAENLLRRASYSMHGSMCQENLAGSLAVDQDSLWWRLSQEARSERAINPIPPTNRTSISKVLNKLVG